MFREYAALMIDLKDSKLYSDEDRNRIQLFWSEATRILNQLFRNTMECDVEITGGDLIQGLFYRPEAAYLYYRLISMCLHPIQTHAGIGIGTCNIRLADKNTGGQDGKAYHAARAASDQADADVGYPIMLLSDTDRDRIVNSVIGTAALMALKHSTYQNQIALLTELLFPLPCEGVETICSEAFEALIRLKLEFDCSLGERQKSIMPLERIIQDHGSAKPAVLAKPRKNERKFFITEGKGRGIPRALSEILGISRQSIDTTLKTADIFNIRNMAIAAMEEMQKI